MFEILLGPVFQVSLPAIYTEEDMLHCAQLLLEYEDASDFPPAVDMIKALASSPALMAYTAKAWPLQQRQYATFEEFVDSYIGDKLFVEVRCKRGRVVEKAAHSMADSLTDAVRCCHAATGSCKP